LRPLETPHHLHTHSQVVVTADKQDVRTLCVMRKLGSNQTSHDSIRSDTHSLSLFVVLHITIR
jgi:hypothetical protein